MTTFMRHPKVAIAIACFNEGQTIRKVVEDFRRMFADAEIFVFDNNSTDCSVDEARKAGAIVQSEVRQGKGFVVNRMFRSIEADAYLMVDGDDTYDPSCGPEMVRLVLEESYDMVIGVRLNQYDSMAFRRFHLIGNRVITSTVNRLFGSNLTDMLSGYRAFSKVFVKTFPALSKGFEVEAELTLHALDKNLRVRELVTSYRERPKGSRSKLRTFKDGLLIARTIFDIFRHYKSFVFFTMLALLLALGGILVGVPVVVDYVQTGLVPRIPSAVLASAIEILALLTFVAGLILDTSNRHQRESFQANLSLYYELERIKSAIQYQGDG